MRGFSLFASGCCNRPEAVRMRGSVHATREAAALPLPGPSSARVRRFPGGSTNWLFASVTYRHV
jgi:hypothetical protein